MQVFGCHELADELAGAGKRDKGQRFDSLAKGHVDELPLRRIFSTKMGLASR
ncbi:hypothetical protein [Mesorhizobium sp.]|uniref:hypothetical protein n=1 Tax=Mesorhizobium sp. TaxID=1871066 RepID=UPI0025FE08EE|nr:hypothetical protein [Mesorhizobium sp.]